MAPVVAVSALVIAGLLFAFGQPPLLRWLPHPDVARMHVDFDTFWRSAHALVTDGVGGASIYRTGAALRNLNPPLLTVLLAPFGTLDPLTAYRCLTVLSVLLVLGAVVVTCRELALGRTWTLLAVGAVLASSPLHGALLLGQIYPLLLAGLVAGWLAERRGRSGAAAVLYGVTVALKPSLAPLLLLPAMQGRRREFGTGIVAAAVAGLAGVTIAGWPTAGQWLLIASTEPVAPSPDNASLPGLAVRWGLPSVVGTVVGVTVLAGTLLHYARRTARYGRSSAAGTDPAGTAPFAVLATGLLAAPIAWHNYLLLLVPGLLVLVASGRPGDTRRRVVGALLAVAVIPVGWADLWASWNPAAPLGLALYSAVLLAAWWSLLRPATDGGALLRPMRATRGAGFRSAEAGVPSGAAPRETPVTDGCGGRDDR